MMASIALALYLLQNTGSSSTVGGLGGEGGERGERGGEREREGRGRGEGRERDGRDREGRERGGREGGERDQRGRGGVMTAVSWLQAQPTRPVSSTCIYQCPVSIYINGRTQ